MQEQKTMGRNIFILLVCIMGCFTLVTLYVPSYLEWYATPAMPQVINCASSIQWALGKMIWSQLASMIVGAFLGAAVIYKFRKKSKTPAA